MSKPRQSPAEKYDQLREAFFRKYNITPPSIPEKATRKALLALQSELRRLERALTDQAGVLTKWENELTAREKELEQDIQEFEYWQSMDASDIENESEGVCEAQNYRQCTCCPDDAMDGCHCVPCQSWREETPEKIPSGEINVTLRSTTVSAPQKGDELDWLNGLFSLKDKRK